MKRLNTTLLAIAFLGLSSCGFFGDPITSTLTGRGPASIAPIGDSALISSVGIKNFNQLNRTMSKLTQVNFYSNQSVRNVYEEVKGSLAASSDLSKLNNGVQKAVVRLGTEYCDAMLNSSVSQVFPNLTLDGTLTTAEKTHMIDIIVNNFWDGTGDVASLDEQKIELTALVDFSASNAINERSAALLICTAGISSSNVLYK